MTNLAQSIDVQVLDILITTYSGCYRVSTGTSYSSDELIDYLYNYFKIPNNHRQLISIEAFIEWQSKKGIIIDIFNSKGERVFNLF